LTACTQADSKNSYYAFVSPQCPSNTNKNNLKACTPHQWAYNPQVSAAYTFKDSSRLFVGFTEKSRFPVLKEMYSFKMGRAFPTRICRPSTRRTGRLAIREPLRETLLRKWNFSAVT
jgi:hypothetical protein